MKLTAELQSRIASRPLVVVLEHRNNVKIICLFLKLRGTDKKPIIGYCSQQWQVDRPQPLDLAISAHLTDDMGEITHGSSMIPQQAEHYMQRNAVTLVATAGQPWAYAQKSQSTMIEGLIKALRHTNKATSTPKQIWCLDTAKALEEMLS